MRTWWEISKVTRLGYFLITIGPLSGVKSGQKGHLAFNLDSDWSGPSLRRIWKLLGYFCDKIGRLFSSAPGRTGD